jgi:GNAT superfamily N-acetyltransferase
MITIEDVTPEDKDEILALFKQDDECKKIWGSGGGQQWYWFWHKDSGKQEYWVKAVDNDGILGFVHWSVRKRDGWRNLQDIIVAGKAQGLGIGRMLVNHIGRPIYLKTDHDSIANRFYQRMGFRQGDTVWSRNGRKQLTYYYLED